MTYEYRHAEVVRVIDGDSAVIEIDLGNRVKWHGPFRLAGINTPERGQPGAAEATERLRVLTANGLSRVQTYKPDKYGRWLCDLWVAVTGGELLVNQALVNEGHAVAYDGGHKP